MFPERIILSRKGFDKGTGKLPSPILPDGRMLSLPIPQYPNGIQAHGKPTTVTTRYCDLHGDGAAFGDHLRQQTARRRIPITGETIVHLDPDIRPDLRPCNREVSTLLFGQGLAAQGHLRNQCVGKNDLFLFYGYFKPCPPSAFPELCREQIARQGIPERELHVLWGWLQVKAKCNIPRNPKKLHGRHITRTFSSRTMLTIAFISEQRLLAFAPGLPELEFFRFTIRASSSVISTSGASMNGAKKRS
jgi:hypothetical protein